MPLHVGDGPADEIAVLEGSPGMGVAILAVSKARGNWAEPCELP